MASCGLDFGTSNTTMGVPVGQPRLLELEGDDVTIPSAIFFAPDGAARIGRAGLDAYVDGHLGRLMRGLKSVLGKPLLDETTQVGRKRVTFRDVIARYLFAVKANAEAAAGHELTAVVLGRPVHFVDDDTAGDRTAEDALRAIAEGIGFRHVTFEYEPVAAAIDYERAASGEEIALVADIGGGTSDFTVVRIGGRKSGGDRRSDILATAGIRVGGTDFDRLLSLRTVMPELGFGSAMKRPGLDVPSSYFHDLASWATVNRLYAPKVRREVEEVRREAARPELIDRLLAVLAQERGHTLAMEVERAKIELSDQSVTEIPLGWLQDDLSVRIDRSTLSAATDMLADRLAMAATRCVEEAGLAREDVDAVFLTGGSTRLEHARAAILSKVPSAKVVTGDTFGSVGTGLTIEAGRRYGSHTDRPSVAATAVG